MTCRPAATAWSIPTSLCWALHERFVSGSSNRRERSSEHEGAEGLALLPGEVTRLQTHGLRLPHIGWNLVRFQRPSPLTAGLPEACAFYHVHTFAPRPVDEGDVLGFAEYGERFASVVARDPLFGVQFHPEKSSVHGLRLLENFAAICARVAA